MLNHKQQAFDLENPKTWRVLVVEDDLSNQELAESILGTFYGADVTVADNGRHALDLLAKGLQPSFVLMDLSMPVMDGFTTYDELRKQPEHRDLPVIALTAHAMKHHRQRVEAAGFTGYITKPFLAKQLIGDIKNILA